MGSVKEKKGYLPLLKQTNYRKLLEANLINRFGDSIDSIALTLLCYALTGSAAWSAFVFGVNRIPTILLQPLAGALVENKNKRAIIISTDVVRGACVFLIVFLYQIGKLSPYCLTGLILLISCAEAFHEPALNSLFPKLLSKKDLEYGISLNASFTSVAELAGSAVAGVIVTAFSMELAIYIDMTTFLLSAFIFLTMTRLPKTTCEIKGAVSNESKQNVWKGLKEGLLYAKNEKQILYFISLAVFLNAILVPFNSLQAPLVTEVLKTGEWMLSVLGVAFTLGMILGAVWYPKVKNKLNGYGIVCFGMGCIGVYYLLLLLAGNVQSMTQRTGMISVISFLTGICIAVFSTYTRVAFYENVNEAYLARVSALNSSLSVCAIPVVSFLISFLARYMNTAQIFMISMIADALACMVLCSKTRYNAYVRNNSFGNAEITEQ